MNTSLHDAPPTPTVKDTSRENALVTGASRGIGASIAKRLARDGFHVVLNYSHQTAKAQEVLDQILKAGGSGELSQFDVAHPEEVDEKIDQLQKRLGPLAILVNNAGISIDSLLVRLKNSDLDRLLAINLKGAIHCTRAVSKVMMRQKKGSIIQLSSVVGEMGNAGQSAYAATKAGLVGFSKSIARELGSRQIRVNVVSPGYIQTEMTESLTEKQKEVILRSVSLEKFGTTEDVASLVAFLASPASQYITGQVIGVNGGMYM